MVDLPQRFVPTSSKSIQHANVVLQCGHNAPVVAVKFSPDLAYFASADARGIVLVWAFDTLDILGSYRIGFAPHRLEWRNDGFLRCTNQTQSFDIDLQVDAQTYLSSGATPLDASRVIRFINSPEIEFHSDNCTIHYGDDAFVYSIPNILQAEIEPCERYGIILAKKKLLIANTAQDEEWLSIDAPQDAEWRQFYISTRGNFVVAIRSDSRIFHLDPIQRTYESVSLSHKSITAYDACCDAYILLGCDNGNVSVYDIATQKIVLSTPRSPLDFVANYPSPARAGFIGLRSESATAFLGASQEILTSAPLPAPVVASCAGATSSEFIAACTDHFIYKIQLESNDIHKICHFSSTPKLLAANGDALAYLDEDDMLWLVSPNGKTSTVANSVKNAKSLTVSDNGASVAVLYAHALTLYTIKKSAVDSVNFDIEECSSIAIIREKTQTNIVLFLNDLSISMLNTKDGSIQNIGVIDGLNSDFISYAYAPKGQIFALYSDAQGHLVVVRIALKTSEIEEVLRVFTSGRQILGVAVSHDALLMRNDVTMLKIVKDFKAYTLDDWTRSDPFFAPQTDFANAEA